MHVSGLDEVLNSKIEQGMSPSLAARIRKLLESLNSICPRLENHGSPRSCSEDAWVDIDQSGLSGQINLIPGGNANQCMDICVAVSSNQPAKNRDLFFSDGSSLLKPKETLRKVRAHMIKCASCCEAVIFFTDYWDMKIFDESRLDFEEHEAQKRWFVPILVSPRQAIAMSWK